jgi:hypothetical protein
LNVKARAHNHAAAQSNDGMAGMAGNAKLDAIATPAIRGIDRRAEE